MTTGDTIDGVLERFEETGPEFGPGLSNHGPMAAEALIAMGREDSIARWAEWYAARLGARPDARQPIAADEWREALGDIKRAGDWTAFFRRELARTPWRDALNLWVGRLSPGIVAGATHGVLRTAHAVRSLDRAETQRRIDELAIGFAYWAARYQEIPNAPMGETGGPIEQAMARLAPLDPETPRAGLIFEVVRRIPAERIETAASLIAVDRDAEGHSGLGRTVDAFVSDLTGAFVRQYIANARPAGIAFVHTVTAPSALRMLAPHLQPETLRATMRDVWQACAAIYVAYGREPAPVIDTSDATSIDRDDLIDRAVAARDEHAIKFTEACLREYDHRPDPAFLVAARDASSRYNSGSGRD